MINYFVLFYKRFSIIFLFLMFTGVPFSQQKTDSVNYSIPKARYGSQRSRTGRQQAGVPFEENIFLGSPVIIFRRQGRDCHERGRITHTVAACKLESSSSSWWRSSEKQERNRFHRKTRSMPVKRSTFAGV